MKKDEQLKNTEILFEKEKEPFGVSQAISPDYVESIFSMENEMLLSIEDYISKKAKDFIVEKIEKQKSILLKIAKIEEKMEERIKNEAKPIIDENYFDKKPLNINNI